MKEKLERDALYTLEVSGDELLTLLFLTARSVGHSTSNLYLKIRSKAEGLGYDRTESPIPETGLRSAWDFHLRGHVKRWKDKILNREIEETEEQRKLRELKEKYEALGQKIKQMEG